MTTANASNPIAATAAQTVTADTPVVVPCVPLFGGIALATIVLASAWWIVSRFGFADPVLAMNGAAGIAMTGLIAVGFALALTPWKPKRIATLPFLWVVASMGRLAVTLGLGFLLYSRPPFERVAFWIAVVAAYVAIQVIEIRVLVLVLRRFTPGTIRAVPPNTTGVSVSPGDLSREHD